ncbi:cysteine-rich repeat secretory protein 38-like isoform X2 [Momordica charantia]|uniref:Cysteine-rich repeat secretory protein 38-like isoform X2 n=1 Tax=Momordica charantia TaxID=3673 RepID=A0A6J1C1J1_MOMCH|nr:cysteine-rich repeat secretory protein 38-like isoform X2 [Momordica charantia]
MRHPKSTIFRSLLLSLFFLLSPPALSGSDIITESSFLNHICISFDNFTAGTPYASNLNQAFDQLTTTAPPSGFALASAGKDPQNQVNGLALCRGDVSPADCKNCVTTAAQEIQVRCPYRKGAAIWYDFCLLKYSNPKFFGKIDNRNQFSLINVQSVDSSNATAFNDQVKRLLTGLAEKVVATPKLYAIGEAAIELFQKKLYGLVQCTRDLSAAACRKCLEDAIGGLSSCCDARIGGRVVGGSCNFRYEIYPIVDAQGS